MMEINVTEAETKLNQILSQVEREKRSLLPVKGSKLRVCRQFSKPHNHLIPRSA